MTTCSERAFIDHSHAETVPPDSCLCFLLLKLPLMASCPCVPCRSEKGHVVQIRLSMGNLAHLDHITSTSSIVPGWHIEGTKAHSVRLMSDLRYHPRGSPLDSLDSLLDSTVEGPPDCAAVLQMRFHQRFVQKRWGHTIM